MLNEDDRESETTHFEAQQIPTHDTLIALSGGYCTWRSHWKERQLSMQEDARSEGT